MTTAHPAVEGYLDGLDRWGDEMRRLRTIVLDSPLREDFKWRSPCYTFRGGAVAALWALRNRCALAFFKGVLLEDPAGVLAAPGANSRSMRTMDFAGMAEISAQEADIRAFIRQAIEVEGSGRTVRFAKDDLDYPEELAAQLEENPHLKTAFDALTPGRRRGWILHFAEAKQPKTRTARIERAAPKILEGKGRHDR